MIIVISPAKTMNFEVSNVSSATIPDFINKANAIAGILKSYSLNKISGMPGISRRLAELNANRYAAWDKNAHEISGKAAILAYSGDVFKALQAETFTDEELATAQKHLRILSGFYGILRPLDLILPYRLEMGTILKIGRAKDLYNYWQDDITAHLCHSMNQVQTDILVNLASDEYFKLVDTKKIKAKIITPVFKEYKNGQYKTISFFAKRARGLMSRFIIQQVITNHEDIKLFNDAGYFYTDQHSDERKWIFSRG